MNWQAIGPGVGQGWIPESQQGVLGGGLQEVPSLLVLPTPALDPLHAQLQASVRKRVWPG